MSALLDEQPAPLRELEGLAVWPRVIAETSDAELVADMLERDRVGRERYGVPLTVWNGRDALADAYQELLDAVVYLEQCRLRVPVSEKPWDPYHPRDVLLSLRRECEGMLVTLRRLRAHVPKEPAR